MKPVTRRQVVIGGAAALVTLAGARSATAQAPPATAGPGDPKLLTCDVYEGHLSSALPHLGNISYRVGRALVFDGKNEKFVDDKQADRLLTRESYRKRFEIPSSFGTTSHHEQARK